MNGWTNRETWLINLWFNPETEDEVNYIEYTLEDEFVNIHGNCGIYIDLMNFGAINWDELRENLRSGSSIGQNPGLSRQWLRVRVPSTPPLSLSYNLKIYI